METVQPVIGRKEDIGLVLVQNNKAHQIIIEEVQGSSSAVETMIGYVPQEITGKFLTDIVPARIREVLEEDIDFDDSEGDDVLDVMKRVPRFCVCSKDGEEIEMDVRMQYGVMDEFPRVILLMSSKSKGADACLKAIEELEPQKVINSETELPDKESFIRAAKVVQQYVSAGKMVASVAIISIDNFDAMAVTVNDGVIAGVLKEVTARSHQNFRSTDVLGYLGNGKFGAVLLKANREDVKVPLSRLRGNIANQPLYIMENKDMNISVSVASYTLEKHQKIEDVMAKCMRGLDHYKDEINQFIEVKS